MSVALARRRRAVELSEAHSNKWRPLLEQIALIKLGVAEAPAPPATSHYRAVTKISQRQKRLDEHEINQLIAEYKAGSTVYQLATRFGCHRTTVSEHLRLNGVQMRLKPLTEERIQEAVRLYESGLSAAKVGERVGANAATVLARLRERGVVIRDAHDRRTSVDSQPN